jgi:MFS family permease
LCAQAGFLFGYDIGGASGAVASLDALSNSTTGAPLDTLLTSVFTSASLMGATAGSVIVFFIGQPLGRRRELLGGSLLYMAGALLSALGGGKVATVIAGRVVYGLGIAMSMHAAPVYIAEMAPADKRGLLVSLKEGFIVLGILAGFAVSAVGSTLVPEDAVFRIVWLPAAFVAAVIFVGMLQVPARPGPSLPPRLTRLDLA